MEGIQDFLWRNPGGRHQGKGRKNKPEGVWGEVESIQPPFEIGPREYRSRKKPDRFFIIATDFGDNTIVEVAVKLFPNNAKYIYFQWLPAFDKEPETPLLPDSEDYPQLSLIEVAGLTAEECFREFGVWKVAPRSPRVSAAYLNRAFGNAKKRIEGFLARGPHSTNPLTPEELRRLREWYIERKSRVNVHHKKNGELPLC